VLAKNNLTLKVYAKGFAVDKFLGQVHERISDLYSIPDEWREFTIPYVTLSPPAWSPDVRRNANPRLFPQRSGSAVRCSLANRPGESGTVRGQLHFRVRFRSPNGTRANTVRPNSVAAMSAGMSSNSSGSLRSFPASPREDLVAAMSQMTLEEASRGLPPLYAPNRIAFARAFTRIWADREACLSLSRALVACATSWEPRRDPSSGRIYYANHQTRQTTWERPRAGPPLPTRQPVAPMPPMGFANECVPLLPLVMA